jgi:hypothetical protein
MPNIACHPRFGVRTSPIVVFSARGYHGLLLQSFSMGLFSFMSVPTFHFIGGKFSLTLQLNRSAALDC